MFYCKKTGMHTKEPILCLPAWWGSPNRTIIFSRPIPGSMTEFRGAEAQARVCTEMKELCEIINEYGKTPCKSLLPPELKDATRVISFGELFSVSARRIKIEHQRKSQKFVHQRIVPNRVFCLKHKLQKNINGPQSLYFEQILSYYFSFFFYVSSNKIPYHHIANIFENNI